MQPFTIRMHSAQALKCKVFEKLQSENKMSQEVCEKISMFCVCAE